MAPLRTAHALLCSTITRFHIAKRQASALVKLQPRAVTAVVSPCRSPYGYSLATFLRRYGSRAIRENGKAAQPTHGGGASVAGAKKGAAGNETVANPEAPFDLSDLTVEFERARARYEKELMRLFMGGRFSRESIGMIAVRPDRKVADTYPLRELATVVPLGGRRWSITAFDEASIKSIISAVQASPDFNQQPQRSDDNPLELIIMTEPEDPDALARRAKDMCLHWKDAVRAASHKRETLHKKWKADKVIGTDDHHRLKKKVTESQDMEMKHIANKEKEALVQIGKIG